MIENSSNYRTQVSGNFEGFYGENSGVVNQQYIINHTEANIHNRPLIRGSPYKGLDIFDADDKDKFFGRDEWIAELVKLVEQSNVLLLVGASGSGKSSLIRAGLIPNLTEIPGLENLVKLIFAPNEDPFDSLHSCLRNRYSKSQAKDANKVEVSTLVRVVNSLKQDAPWLIFVDQFEELFTLTPEQERNTFIESLVTLITEKEQDSSLKLVMTMRSDFFERLSKYPELVKKTDKYTRLLTDMRVSELRLAIAEPAARNGVTFEKGLVDQIIEDFKKRAGSLPLLQYTLNSLWKEDHVEDRVLNWDTYKQLGGVAGALEQQANKIYEQLNEKQKEAAKRILLGLVDLVDDKPVSRRENQSQFRDDGDGDVLDKLIEERLLVIGRQKEQQKEQEEMVEVAHEELLIGRQKEQQKEQEEMVEVAHEELLRSWKLFNNLITEKKEILNLRNRLISDAKHWMQEKEKDQQKARDELWGGAKLERVLEVRQDPAFKLDKEIEQFIDASVEWRASLLREKEEQIKKLERALTEANLREQAGKVNNLIKDYPVEALLLAIKTTCSSAEKLEGEVLNPVLDSLQWAINVVRERNRCRHEFGVSCVTFAPNGQVIISGNQDGKLRLWDLWGNPIGQPFQAHEDVVSAIAFSRDGQLIVTGSHDKTLGLWNLQGDQFVGTLFLGHEDWVYSVAMSPDSLMIASASHDGTVRLWDLQGNAIGQPLRGHDAPVTCVTFSPDGQLIISGGHDGALRLWSLQGEQIAVLSQGQNDLMISSVAISPDGQLVASGSIEGMLCLWNVQQQQIESLFPSRDRDVTSVAFSPNGELIVSSDKSTVCLWNRRGQQIRLPLRGHENRINSVAFSPDGQWLVSGSADRTWRLWSLESNFPRKLFQAHKGRIHSVAFSLSSQRIVSGSDDGTIGLWDLEGNLTAPLFQGHEGRVNSVAFSPDGQQIVSGSDDATLRLWDLQGNAVGQPFQGHEDVVNSVAFSPDGQRIVSGSDDATLRLWDLQGNAIGQPFQGHEDVVNSVAFSPDGQWIVSGSGDTTLRLWDLQGNAIPRPFEGHEGEVKSVTFSPDGQLIVSGSEDRTIRLWNLQGNAVRQPFVGHEGAVTSATFSPDGQLIISGSYDKTLRLWDLQGVSIGPPLEGHKDVVNAVAFSPDGRWIVSGSYDRTLKLWQEHNWKTCLQIACNFLRHHSLFVQSASEDAIEACNFCQKYV